MDGAACVQLCSDPPIFKYKLTALTFRICLVYIMPGTSGLEEVNLLFPTLQDFNQFISPYQQSSDPGEEFKKLLHDTGFEVTDCECRDCE